MTLPTVYDYQRQAWVCDGRYVRCGHEPVNCAGFDHGHTNANTRANCRHVEAQRCQCYGRLHEGEAVTVHTSTDCGATVQPEFYGAHVEGDCPLPPATI